MKRLIALRKRFRALGRGSLEFLSPSNHKILAFVRRPPESSGEGEAIACVFNLSAEPRFAEAPELAGATLLETRAGVE